MCHVILSSRVRVYVVKHTRTCSNAEPIYEGRGNDQIYETQTSAQALATRGHGHNIHDVHVNKHIAP